MDGSVTKDAVCQTRSQQPNQPGGFWRSLNPIAECFGKHHQDADYAYGFGAGTAWEAYSGNGQPPVVVIGTPGVFDVQISTTNGKDYFIKLIPIGQIPGAQAGVYLDGLKLFVATVEAPAAPSVRSDTTCPFTVRSGASYILKLTAGSRPTLVPGSAGAFKVEFIKSSGNEYFFRIVPTGKRGASTGLYINSGKVPVTIATVA